MALIFGGSTDLFAEHRASRILGPILRWFDPRISDAAIQRVQMVARKTAHFTEYAVLALLVCRALSSRHQLPGGSPNDKLVHGRPGEEAATPLGSAARRAAVALLICALYALSDEAHQAFVPTRHASLQDVLLDCAGAVGGLAMAGLVRQRRRTRGRRQAQRESQNLPR